VGSITFYFLLPIFLFANLYGNHHLAPDIDHVNLKLEEGELAVTFLELSSGEATLIQHANGENILINTGGPSTKKQLENILQKYHVSSFKAVIITKYDKQYTANLPWILKNYTVDKLISGSKILNWPEKERTFIKWTTGEKHELLPNTIFHVLHEDRDFEGRKGMDISIRFGRTHFLFMSSADYEVEKKFKKIFSLSDVNILKVADFGSEHGTSQSFLNHVDPHVSVIFKEKGLMPSPALIERLHESWIDLYQTRDFGNITIKCDDKHYDIITISLESSQEIPMY
jgi:competence protein ComEC